MSASVPLPLPLSMYCLLPTAYCLSSYSVERIHDLCRIDKWFLAKLQNITQIRNNIKWKSLSVACILPNPQSHSQLHLSSNPTTTKTTTTTTNALACDVADITDVDVDVVDRRRFNHLRLVLDTNTLRVAKQRGFSDVQLSKLLQGSVSALEIRRHRELVGVIPRIKRIDTLAAEYPAMTNYYYATYCASSNDYSQEQSQSPPKQYDENGLTEVGWFGIFS